MPRRDARDLRTDREVREILSKDTHTFFDCGGACSMSGCQNPLLFSHTIQLYCISPTANRPPPLLNSAGLPVRLAHRRRRRRGCVPPTFPWVARQDLERDGAGPVGLLYLVTKMDWCGVRLRIVQGAGVLLERAPARQLEGEQGGAHHQGQEGGGSVGRQGGRRWGRCGCAGGEGRGRGSIHGKAIEPVVADQEAPVNGGSQACEEGQGAGPGGPSSRSGDSGGSAWAPRRSHIQSRLRQHLRR